MVTEPTGRNLDFRGEVSGEEEGNTGVQIKKKLWDDVEIPLLDIVIF